MIGLRRMSSGVLCAVLASANTAQAQEVVQLFNGKDLASWDGNPKFWSVENGAITGRTTATNPLAQNTFLIWKGGTVDNFELRLRVRIVADNDRGFANSGIQYRSRLIDSTAWVVGGYQADLDAAGEYTGALYEEQGRGILARPTDRARPRPNEWNDYVIIVAGNRHRFYVNGNLTVDAVDTNRTRGARSGILALQLHSGAPMTVQFKDILLRRTRVEWPAYGGTHESIRYSPLDQINRDNVKRLNVAWTFDASDGAFDSELEVNPIVVDGVLYATTVSHSVVALNAATGEVLWRFDPYAGRGVRGGGGRTRGVMYWAGASGGEQRIFVGVQQFLYALDAKTGRPAASFGNAGRIDMRDDLRPGEKLMISLGTPGIVYKDLLILGSRTAENLPTPPGDIRAYDARTGALRWTFHTIPRQGELGYDTWPPEAWTYIGAANNWAGMSLDERRGLLFVPTGSAAADYYGANRAGNNLFANSLIALNAETGERVWHFQVVRHDIWDRDLPAQPSLVTVRRDGHAVDAVAQTTKSGHVYVFERQTGKPLFPIEYRKYPASDVEGEVAADSQPLPVLPAPFARQQLTREMLTERTPEAHAAVLERFMKLRSGGQFVPASLQGTVVFPGLDGGGEWGGPAFDPETSVLYVNSNEMPWIVRLEENLPEAPTMSGKDLFETHCASCHGVDLKGTPPQNPSLLNITDKLTAPEIRAIMMEGSGRMPGFAHLQPNVLTAIQRYVQSRERVVVQTVTKPAGPIEQKYRERYEKFRDPDGYPAVKPPWGTLSAIDLNTGEYRWRIPLGEHPALVEKGMTGTGSENYGGPLVTAGGLLFIGATNYDRKFRAFDKYSGQLLWETTMAGSGNATPATYEVNGRQYVVIATSHGKSGTRGPATYIAFAAAQQ